MDSYGAVEQFGQFRKPTGDLCKISIGITPRLPVKDSTVIHPEPQLDCSYKTSCHTCICWFHSMKQCLVCFFCYAFHRLLYTSRLLSYWWVHYITWSFLSGMEWHVQFVVWVTIYAIFNFSELILIDFHWSFKKNLGSNWAHFCWYIWQSWYLNHYSIKAFESCRRVICS